MIYKLSVCIPSRNRQIYFQKTIDALLVNPRRDVDFVFVDNSDDPSVMINFMEKYKKDSRVTFVPSDDFVHSLMSNWERACLPARGEYVCLIGDDDYIDLDAVDLIEILKSAGPKPDVVGWSRPVYYWPTESQSGTTFVELNTYCGYVPKHILVDRAIHWKDHTIGIPHYPFTIYHNAVSRDVITKIRENGNGLLFENSIPDIEFGLKLLIFADHFAYTARPYTVAGICAASNGASYGNLKQIRTIQQSFHEDLGRHTEGDPHLREFPFPIYLGNTIVIAQTHLWFRERFGIDDPTWEFNFVKACAESCAYWKSEDDYEVVVAAFRKAFSVWRNGRYSKEFVPGERLTYRSGELRFLGFQIALNVYGPQRYVRVWVDDRIGGASTPGEFFEVVKGILPTAHELTYMVGQNSEPVLNGFRS